MSARSWPVCSRIERYLTPLPNARFNSDNARRRLEAVYEVAALDAFGEFDRAQLAAAGALIDYVELTQVGKLPRLGLPRHVGSGALLEIDAATRRSLELTRTLTGSRREAYVRSTERLQVLGPGCWPTGCRASDGPEGDRRTPGPG